MRCPRPRAPLRPSPPDPPRGAAVCFLTRLHGAGDRTRRCSLTDGGAQPWQILSHFFYFFTQKAAPWGAAPGWAPHRRAPAQTQPGTSSPSCGRSQSRTPPAPACGGASPGRASEKAARKAGEGTCGTTPIAAHVYSQAAAAGAFPARAKAEQHALR